MPNLTINLLKDKAYPTTLKCATRFVNSVKNDFILKNGKAIGAKTVAISTDMAPVVGLTLWTPEKRIAACSTPGIEPLRSVPSMVCKLIEKLKQESRKSFDNMFAFITGGVAYGSKNANAKESVELVDSIYNTLQREGIETSVIAEQFADSKVQRLNSYCVANNITIWGEPINQAKLTKNSGVEEIENALSETFDFVELSDGIETKVIDELPISTQEAVKRAK